ncbi:MAG: pilus assembly PilX family protein [Thermodesulfobacteriota bacterium]
MKNVKREDGIALIIALIMLLTMTMLAISVSFTSNVDFQTMSNYKQGQEAFLAAERCVEEAKRQFESTGIVPMFLLLQAGVGPSVEVDLPNGARCRTGPRDYDVSDGPIPFIQIPPPTKAMGRLLKNTSLPSGGMGGAVMLETNFIVTGKDARDKDKDDNNPDINTGTEIAAGFESFLAGGASNVY